MRWSRTVRALVVSFGATLLAESAAAQSTTERVSVDSSGVEGNGESLVSAISADGTVVAFSSIATNLVGNDRNDKRDVFVHDRATGATKRVSVNATGRGGNGDSWSGHNAISADGQVVAFMSSADNLVSGDTNSSIDVFVRDRSTGTTERVSVDSSGNQAKYDSNDVASISADGNVVAFASFASLEARDTNFDLDVYVHDRTTGITELVSVDASNGAADGMSYSPAVSSDGRFVAFGSYASDLVPNDTNFVRDVFVRDRVLGTTELVSVHSNGNQANEQSEHPAISGDGQYVAFASYASNLVNSDGNDKEDVFVRDRVAGKTRRVSESSSGAEGNFESLLPSISVDGAVVAFTSGADNLVPGDDNVEWDVFVHDRASGRTTRVSVDGSGAEGNDYSVRGSLSADGQIVSFGSWASDLVVGDTNSTADVFVHERCQADATWSNYDAGYPGTYGVPSLAAQGDPVLGATLTLDVGNSSGDYTYGLLFVGFQRATIHSAWGGDLLVLPEITLVLGLAPAGTSVGAVVPDDDAFCGGTIDVQVIEGDAGAAYGVSFTPGLELLLGH